MNTHNFKLVDSTYDANDAKSVLISIIQDKINSLNKLCFSIEEMGGYDVTHFRNRVSQLKEMKAEIRYLLKHAEENDMQVEVDATIQVTLKKTELAI